MTQNPPVSHAIVAPSAACFRTGASPRSKSTRTNPGTVTLVNRAMLQAVAGPWTNARLRRSAMAKREPSLLNVARATPNGLTTSIRTDAGRSAKRRRSPRKRPFCPETSPKWSSFPFPWTAFAHEKVACMRASAASALGGTDAGGAMRAHPVQATQAASHPDRARRGPISSMGGRYQCVTQRGVSLNRTSSSHGCQQVDTYNSSMLRKIQRSRWPPSC